MNITIYGRIPSKKNCKQAFVIGGRAIIVDNPKYKGWHKEASAQLLGTRKAGIGNAKRLSITFFAPDKRKTDLTNKAESIMDLLVDNGILEDDNWYCVPELSLSFGGVDVPNPRAEITIEL